ncbi:DASH complex subunit Spc19p [Diutina catenulata]
MADFKPALARIENSSELLRECLDELTEYTRDIPKLKNVLVSKPVFGLVPNSDMKSAQSDFSESVRMRLLMIEENHRQHVLTLKRKRDIMRKQIEYRARNRVYRLPESVERRISPEKARSIKNLIERRNRLLRSLEHRNYRNDLNATR